MKLCSNGREGAQRVAAADRTLVTQEHDATAPRRCDHTDFSTVQSADDANLLPRFQSPAQMRTRYEQPVVGRGVMDLQMGFLRVIGRANFLTTQLRGRAWHASQAVQQLVQSAVQRLQVARLAAAGAAAFDVDGRDVAGVGGAERASGKKGAGPAPEIVEACSHFALNFTGTVGPDKITSPRQQFAGEAAAVQVDVVGTLREQLGVEQIGQPRRDRTSGLARKHAGQIEAVGRIATLAGKEGGLVQDGYHDDGSGQTIRAPLRRPLVQQSRTLVFVAVRGTVEQQDRPRFAAPNEEIEAYIARFDPPAVKTGGQTSEIDLRF